MNPVKKLIIVTSRSVMKVGRLSSLPPPPVDNFPGGPLSLDTASVADEPDAIDRHDRPDVP
jgi:hypothetical protein